MFAFIKNSHKKQFEIIKRKNADYGGNRGPWTNFLFSELVGVSVAKAILVRMTDKMSRIGNLLDQEAQVKEETIEDALDDLANYSNLLKAWLHTKRSKTGSKI